MHFFPNILSKSKLNGGFEELKGERYIYIYTHKNGHEAGDQHLSPGSTKNEKWTVVPIFIVTDPRKSGDFSSDGVGFTHPRK